MPAWATIMPSISAVKRPLPRRRCQTKRAVPSATQAAAATPMPAFQPFCGACHQASAPSSTASPSHGASSANAREVWSRCHFTSGPNGSSRIIGAISSRNRLPK